MVPAEIARADTASATAARIASVVNLCMVSDSSRVSRKWAARAHSITPVAARNGSLSHDTDRITITPLLRTNGVPMVLSFFGAAGSVTGAKYMLRIDDRNILVDCGLFQGLKNLRQRNWEEPPFDIKTIDAVVLTHAHIDHSGYLPVLMKRGYTGPIYCTEATADLCGIMLPDSGHLQEEEARYIGKKGVGRHDPVLPLYTREDAEQTLKLLEPVPFD